MIDGDLELGILTYDPEDERLVSKVIYHDHLAFIVSPQHRLAERGTRFRSTELGEETFIAHNVVSPYRGVVMREFQRHKVPLIWIWRCRPSRRSARWCERNEGVAFLPRMCVEQEIRQGMLKESR